MSMGINVKLSNTVGDSAGKVHIYNKEEKQQIIRRYLAKKKGRNFRKVENTHGLASDFT